MLIPKTIYMTYKNNPPSKVFNRWKALNPDYNIDFSLDEDCLSYLKDNFGTYFVDLFNSIKQGMYKADLWRLCKLYLNGGIYADIDLIPYFKLDELIQELQSKILNTTEHIFYSCLANDRHSVFQAFMITTPKNPMILQYLISYVLNKPYQGQHNGPTYDMFRCLIYNTNTREIKPETIYKLNHVIVPLIINDIKRLEHLEIDLQYFPDGVNYHLLCQNQSLQSHLDMKINNGTIQITKKGNIPDDTMKENIVVFLVIPCDAVFLLFPEKKDPGTNYLDCYITYQEKKILDSRDREYALKKEKGENYV